MPTIILQWKPQYKHMLIPRSICKVALEEGSCVDQYVIECGWDFVVNSLVDMYAKARSIEHSIEFCAIL
jgi:hypothetical protein